MTITLNAETTVELLNKAVEDRGESYVYPDDQKDPNGYGHAHSVCRYVFRGPRGGLKGAGCIVGHVLATAGVPVKVMAPYDVAGDGNVTAGVALLRDLHNLGILEYDSTVERMLETAQTEQDSGSTWGEAVTSAVHGYED